MKLSEELEKYDQIDAFIHLARWASEAAKLEAVVEAAKRLDWLNTPGNVAMAGDWDSAFDNLHYAVSALED